MGSGCVTALEGGVPCDGDVLTCLSSFLSPRFYFVPFFGPFVNG